MGISNECWNGSTLVHPENGTFESFMTDLEGLFKKHYKNSYDYQFKHEDDWIFMNIQLAGDKE